VILLFIGTELFIGYLILYCFLLIRLKIIIKKKNFIIRHEDLKYNHRKTFLKICRILNIPYSKSLEKPTFLNKNWNDKYYQPNNTSIVKANFNINKNFRILNYLLEGLMYEQLKKCRYKLHFFKNKNLEKIKIFFYILLFNEIEKIEFYKLFSKKNFFNYLKLASVKDGNIKSKKFYANNLFYRYKSTIGDLNLYQTRNVENNKFYRLFISILKYLRAIIGFFYYFLKRVIICYRIFFYRTKNRYTVI